ncbi:MAG: hypothetical protein KKD11_04945 [Candidatus Omnitrophica bacterium]|nr:hypothetical protein [Candidatus Omnitrophota bacterium]
MEEAISEIEKFQVRQYGLNPDKFTDPVIATGYGIGGQMTCAIPATTFIVKHKNRQFIPCDSLGINYKKIEDEMVSALRADPKTKLPWAVGSKSGGTDETMVNFQMGLKTQIRVWSRYLSGLDSMGEELASSLIEKLFNSTPLFETTLEDLKLTENELGVLRVVFENLIVVTGEWADEKGSRLDRLIKESFVKDLYENEADKVISILMLPNLGGRFQALSPNGFVYNALLGMDIKEMLEAARAEAVEQRKPGIHRSEQVARDLYENEIKHLLIAIPNEPVFGRTSEALGQIVPESTGKGRARGIPLGIQTYAYDQELINTAFRDFQTTGKAYLIIDIEGEKPIKLDKEIEENNLIIRYTLKSISEGEFAKLIQFVENMTAKYGMFNTAKVLTEAASRMNGIDLEDRETIIKIMQGPGEKDGNRENLSKLHELFNDVTPFRQPDVEGAKKLIKDGGGIAFFNSVNKTNVSELPVRAADEREAYYSGNNKMVSSGPMVKRLSLGLRNDKGKFIKGLAAHKLLLTALAEMQYSDQEYIHKDYKKDIVELIERSGLLQTEIARSGVPLETFHAMQAKKTDRNRLLKLIEASASSTRLDPEMEETAQLVAALLNKAHSQDKSLNLVFYEDRNTATEVLKKYLEFIGFDRVDFSPAEQHKSFQLAAGGVDVSIELLVHSVKELSNVQRGQELIKYDGCVPQYLHDLYPSEVSELYLKAYSDRFRQDSVQTESVVLMAKDVTINENVAELMLVLTRAMDIYKQNAKLVSQETLTERLEKGSAVTDL